MNEHYSGVTLLPPPNLHSWLNSGIEDLAKLELVVNSYYLRDHLALERRHIVPPCVWFYRTWGEKEWQKWEEAIVLVQGLPPGTCKTHCCEYALLSCRTCFALATEPLQGGPVKFSSHFDSDL